MSLYTVALCPYNFLIVEFTAFHSFHISFASHQHDTCCEGGYAFTATRQPQPRPADSDERGAGTTLGHVSSRALSARFSIRISVRKWHLRKLWLSTLVSAACISAVAQSEAAARPPRTLLFLLRWVGSSIRPPKPGFTVL